MIRVHRICEGCARRFAQDHTVGEPLDAFCERCIDPYPQSMCAGDGPIRTEGGDIEALEALQRP